MTKLVFTGAAQPKPQIDTITLAGTWVAAETVTIKVGLKTVTYTVVTSDTPTLVAVALHALCNAASMAEFGEITWTILGAVITATSDDGLPVTIAVSETSAAGTIALASVQVATGSSHWDNVDNWSTGAVPVDTDEVYIEDADHIILHGLPTTLAPARLVIQRGQLGNPDRNPNGYPEYRTKRAVISCVDVQIGLNQGFVGPSLVRMSTLNAAAVVVVYASGVARDGYAIDLLCNNAAASVSVLGGQVGIAPGGEEVSVIGSARCGANGTLLLGQGVTVTTVIAAGRLEQWASSTTLTIDAGETRLYGSALPATTDIRGGRLIHATVATIAALLIGPGEVDFGQDIRPRTVTACTLRKGGTITDPYRAITFTGGVVMGSDADRLQAS